MTVARFDKFCLLCKHFEEARCKKYEVEVFPRFTCDDWERNPSIPPQAV